MQFAPIDLEDFRAEILALYLPPLRAKRTYSKMRSTLKRFSEVGAKTTADFTPSFVAKFASSLFESGSNANTVHGALGYLRAAASFAVQTGRLEVSPFMVRRPFVRRQDPLRRSAVPARELASLLALVSSESILGFREGRLEAIVSIGAYLGLRRDELLFLRWESIDLAGGNLEVRPRSGGSLKTLASAAVLPMPSILTEVLEAWRPRSESDWVVPKLNRLGPWSEGSQGSKPIDALRRAGERVGIERLSFQSLRHAWATHAESLWGLPELVIQRILRHSSPMTQKAYRKSDLDNLRSRIGPIRYSEPTREESAA